MTVEDVAHVSAVPVPTDLQLSPEASTPWGNSVISAHHGAALVSVRGNAGGTSYPILSLDQQ